MDPKPQTLKQKTLDTKKKALNPRNNLKPEALNQQTQLSLVAPLVPPVLIPEVRRKTSQKTPSSANSTGRGLGMAIAVQGFGFKV